MANFKKRKQDNNSRKIDYDQLVKMRKPVAYLDEGDVSKGIKLPDPDKSEKPYIKKTYRTLMLQKKAKFKADRNEVITSIVQNPDPFRGKVGSLKIILNNKLQML